MKLIQKKAEPTAEKRQTANNTARSSHVTAPDFLSDFPLEKIINSLFVPFQVSFSRSQRVLANRVGPFGMSVHASIHSLGSVKFCSCCSTGLGHVILHPPTPRTERSGPPWPPAPHCAVRFSLETVHQQAWKLGDGSQVVLPAGLCPRSCKRAGRGSARPS